MKEAVLAAQEEVMAECDGLEGFDFVEFEQDLEDLQDAELKALRTGASTDFEDLKMRYMHR